MDTWMDSSITPLHLRGWPDDISTDEFEPVALRPQGHDIIRTWAFYTLLRTGELTDERPWNTVLINGMVFGPDGNKMSKSRGNVVTPREAIDDYGADAVRQALALGGQPGADVQFQPKEATSASRFNTKVWNITKFAAGHIDERTVDVEDPAYRDADRWILGRAAEVAERVDEAMAEYRYDTALRELREFVWHDLADDYLELVKGRLYEGRPGERNAARHALLTALSSSLRMLAPFAPFLTEEAYDALPGLEGSVHAAEWPDLPSFDEASVHRGQLVADVASEIRSWKSDQGMALNAELDRIEVFADHDDEAALDTYDLSSAVNAPVYHESGRPNVELVPVGVDPDHASIGPKFRDEAGAVIGALESADPAALKAQQETNGEVELDVGGEVVVLDADAFEVLEEQQAASGEEVAVVELDDATVLIYGG
jgi:valyl-tRNA synthetase